LPVGTSSVISKYTKTWVSCNYLPADDFFVFYWSRTASVVCKYDCQRIPRPTLHIPNYAIPLTKSGAVVSVPKTYKPSLKSAPTIPSPTALSSFFAAHRLLLKNKDDISCRRSVADIYLGHFYFLSTANTGCTMSAITAASSDIQPQHPSAYLYMPNYVYIPPAKSGAVVFVPKTYNFL
jgi:hypothetical protein